ncbi:hypothetical protein Tco_1182654 [Tanacetum coccineum]
MPRVRNDVEVIKIRGGVSVGRNREEFCEDFWIAIEFQSTDSCKKIQNHAGIKSWFSSIRKASKDYFIRDRVAWIDVEGILEFLEDTSRIEVEGNDDVEGPVGSVSDVDTKNWNEDDDEEEQVEDSYFTMASPHEDSNHIYDYLFDLIKTQGDKGRSEKLNQVENELERSSDNYEDKKTIIEGTHDSNVGSFHEGSRDDVIEFGQEMGFDMKGCEKDMKRIITRMGGTIDHK